MRGSRGGTGRVKSPVIDSRHSFSSALFSAPRIRPQIPVYLRASPTLSHCTASATSRLRVVICLSSSERNLATLI